MYSIRQRKRLWNSDRVVQLTCLHLRTTTYTLTAHCICSSVIDGKKKKKKQHTPTSSNIESLCIGKHTVCLAMSLSLSIYMCYERVFARSLSVYHTCIHRASVCTRAPCVRMYVLYECATRVHANVCDDISCDRSHHMYFCHSFCGSQLHKFFFLSSLQFFSSSSLVVVFVVFT